jgi:pimeloyl-ACP methyl ester carboxylesterase
VRGTRVRVPRGRAGLLRRTGVAGATVLTTVLTTVLASCSLLGGDGAAPEPQALEPSGEVAPVEPTLLRFYDQQVDWRECREEMECTEIEVPLDYAAPDGDVITLSVLRAPATDGDRRIGSLVVNPGGPGASGVDYAARHEMFFGDEVRAAFDIVGFDPRGVGGSTPVDCLTDPAMDAFVAADPDPDDPAELRAAQDLMRDFGQGCLDRSGDLAAHVSTVEAARDMDVLRGVLDQEQLAYFGASYGTYLGATYADLFPSRVGRLVLDGAVDPSLGSVEMGLVQAEGFEVALRAYVADCVEERDCYLGSSIDEGVARIGSFLESLDAEPIPGDDDRELTEGLAVFGIWAPLYSRQSWPALDVALGQALDGEGAALLALADI